GTRTTRSALATPTATMSAFRSCRPAGQPHGPTAADLPHPKRLHSMIRILLRSSLATRDAASSPPRATSRQPLSLFTVPSRWPLLLLLLALLLSAGSAVGLTRLRPDARVDLLIDPNAAAFKDQALFADTFGADPVVVMAKPAPGSSLITPDHLVGLFHLQGTLHPGRAARARRPARPALLDLGPAGHAARGDHRATRP